MLDGTSAATAANAANTAATLANTKAGLADTAANRANDAAAALEDMDATATTLTPGSSATATVSTVDGHYRVALGIPQGDKGDTGDIGPTPAFSIGTVETLEPSEDATATITGTAAAPVLNLGIPKGDAGEVTEAELDAAIATAAPAIIASAGPAEIVSVTDGAEDALVKSLVVSIEPVQDLHGYDHPWPAGGGKNKCLLDAETITKPSWYTGNWTGTTLNNRNGINQDKGYLQGGAGGFTISGLSAGIYTFSMTFTGETTYCIFYASSTTDGADSVILVNNEGMSKSGTRYSYTFEVPSGSIQVAIRPTIYTATTEYVLEDIQVESGSTATAWTPYSNICPITGWTGVEIARSGANLLPTYTGGVTQNGITYTANADGSVTVNGTATATNTYTAPLGTWTWDGAQDMWLSGCPTGGNYYNGYSLRVDRRGSGWSIPDTGRGVNLADYDSSTKIIGQRLRFCIVIRNGTVCNNLVFKPMLNFGSSALPYEGYKGVQTYPVTLPAEAGTVYGGTLTLNSDGSGELVVDRTEIDLGTRTWDKTSGGFYCNEIPDALPGTTSLRYDHIQCSSYKAVNVASVAGLQNGECSIDSGKHIQIRDIRYTDAASFKIAMSGVQLVYELEEPITYHLTAPQIRTLLGANNIWADAGPISVEYTADTKMYIDSQTRATRSLIAGIETDMTASRPYAAGDLLIVGDTLYKAAASIASGATLTPGTNVTPTTVAEQLILLANA